MVADDHERPRPERRVDAARRIRQDDDPGAEPPEQQHRLDDESRIVALVHVEAALEHDDGLAGQPSEQQPPDMARRGRGRPAGQLGERDGDGILDVVGEPAEAGAQDDPDLGDDVGPGANGRLEGGETSGLLGRRDRAGGVDRRSLTGVRASRMRVQGEDGRGPRLCPPDGCTDTGMPVAIRRAFALESAGADVAGNKAPEATGPDWRPLM